MMQPLLLKPVFHTGDKTPDSLKRFFDASETAVPQNAAGCSFVHSESVIENGDNQGRTLGDLLKEDAKSIMGGNADYSPLSVNLLHISERMPLQVLPPDASGANRNSLFYHLIDGPGIKGKIGVGAKHLTANNRVISKLNTPELIDTIQLYPARKGDSFQIPPGVMHFLGEGVLALEVKNAGVTARTLSRWGHLLDEAEQQEALSFTSLENRHVGRIAGDAGKAFHTKRIPLVIHCPDFLIDEYRVRDFVHDQTNGTYHLICPLQGKLGLLTETSETELVSGRICCVPASVGAYRIHNLTEDASYLKIIPNEV